MRTWRFLGTIAALAGIAIVIARGHVQPSALVEPLTRLGGGAAGLAIGCVMLQLALLATRLWIVFPAASRPSWPRVARAFAIGQLLNNFLRRAGDVLKLLLLGGNRSEVVGVLVSDKVIDLVVLCVLVACAGATVPVGGWWLAAAAIATAVAIVVVRRRSPMAARLLHGMSALRDPRRLGAAAWLAVASWSAEIAALHCLAGALGYDLSIADAVRALVLMNVATAVPLSVANLGTFEAGIAVALHAAGMSLAEGVAVGAAYHAIQILATALSALVGAVAYRRWPAPFAQPEVS